jgi:hypothetical protein
MNNDKDITVVPARAGQWQDLETLFGQKGAYAGCWCMFWRMNRADFKQGKGEGTKAVLKSLVTESQVPGVLAYVNGEVAGWCSIGPRQDYLPLENSRILKRVDDQPVWSVVCFFVTKAHRLQGLMEPLHAPLRRVNRLAQEIAGELVLRADAEQLQAQVWPKKLNHDRQDDNDQDDDQGVFQPGERPFGLTGRPGITHARSLRTTRSLELPQG